MKLALLYLLLAPWFAAACAPAHRFARPPAHAELPPLPDYITTVRGPIPVVVVDTIGIADSTRYIIGRFDYFTRRILIRRSLKERANQWHTLEHERCHVTFLEAGLNVEPAMYLELICDAFANARVADMIALSSRPR